MTHYTQTEQAIVNRALDILASKMGNREGSFTSPDAAAKFAQLKIGAAEREVFAVLMLDSQHRLIEFKELFFGTIDSASVYPREVVKAALAVNAAAVIFAHNHPSGMVEPSRTDKLITERLVNALDTIDVRVLDHIVVSPVEFYSFSVYGLI